jgi:glyoxylate/hydroxypyruvate reductase A
LIVRIVCCLDSDGIAWRDALRAALPDASVETWTRDAPPSDYAVVWRPPQEFFDTQPRLKAIFNAGAGVDALLALRLPADVPLVRLEDAGMAEQMADYVMHAVLRHFREFDVYDSQARAHVWKPREPRRKVDFPIGILGFGVLGEHVTRSLQTMGFPVHAWTRTPKEAIGLRVFSGAAGLEDFLQATRILVCLLPLTVETRGIINRRTLGLLRPDAYVINVARGGHVVESDLVEALREGRLAGAALDVFEEEPLHASHRLWDQPGIAVTPHISAATRRDEAVDQIARKILAMERGETPTGVVDQRRGY